MKKQIKKRENGKLRVIHHCNDKSLTDQSSKNMCDINLIMKQYQKTGLLPQFNSKVGQYLDVSEVLSFEEAHEIINLGKELFYELPSEVRKLMNHDPSQLEAFLADENNYDVCLKYGLVEKKQEVEPAAQATGNQASDSAQAQSSDKK